MKVNKKKVSFDIEVKDLTSIKSFCEKNKLKQSDFYRAAAIEKFLRDNKYKIVFFFDVVSNKFKKLTVDTQNYNIDEFETDDETKADLSIKSIVIISKPDKNYDELNDLDILLAKNNDTLKCFVK